MCRCLRSCTGLRGQAIQTTSWASRRKAYQCGFHVVRLNQRNCGDSEKLTPTLYNSGMSADYRAVLEELADSDGFTQIFFAGYSMGGNLVTKWLGVRRCGAACAARSLRDLPKRWIWLLAPMR